MAYYSIISTSAINDRGEIKTYPLRALAVSNTKHKAQWLHQRTGLTVYYDILNDDGNYVECGKIYDGRTHIDHEATGCMYANAKEMAEIRKAAGIYDIH